MLSLVLPGRCLHCESPVARAEGTRFVAKLSSYLCASCLKIFEKGETPNPEHLRDQLSMFCPIDEQASVITSQTFIQDGLVQSLVHSFKYNEMPRLARHIGEDLAKKWKSERDKFDLLVAVPLHRTRLAERGYNQSEEIARGLGAIWNLPALSEKVVRRIRPTRSQALLSIPERLENVQGAFRLSKHGAKIVRSKRVLIIDDVVTTGSTVASVANELQRAEPACVSVFVFASAVSRT